MLFPWVLVIKVIMVIAVIMVSHDQFPPSVL